VLKMGWSQERLVLTHMHVGLVLTEGIHLSRLFYCVSGFVWWGNILLLQAQQDYIDLWTSPEKLFMCSCMV